MELRRNIILFTSDARLAPEIAAALAMPGEFPDEMICPDLAELAAHIERNPASVVLVDIDPNPSHILAGLDQMTRRFDQARFVVLSGSLEGELVLQAMRAGARQFVLKGSILSELSAALERIAPPETSAAQARGALVTVLSASGGCGATTVAVNLANELHLTSLAADAPARKYLFFGTSGRSRASRKKGESNRSSAGTAGRVLIVDMDIDYGAVGAYLGLQGQYGLADVLAYRGQIDPELIRSTALAYSDGLHALLSPVAAGLSQWELPVDERIGQAIEACQRAYAYTVVDAPRISLELAARLAHASLFTLVVFQLSVKDVRIARALHTALTSGGVPSGRVIPVVNRYRSKHAMVGLEEARRAIGGYSPVCIQNDYRNVTRSINYGQPLSEIARRSVARRDIAAMARKIVNAGMGDALAPASR